MLSSRERKVLELAARGLKNAEIGGVVGKSSATVAWMLSRIYARLGLAGQGARQRAILMHFQDEVPLLSPPLTGDDLTDAVNALRWAGGHHLVERASVVGRVLR